MVRIGGSIVIGSVSANVDSIFIQSGANMLGSVGITTNPLPVSGIVNITNYPTIQKSNDAPTNGSIWIGSDTQIILRGPRSGLIIQNLGPNDLTINFAASTVGSTGFELKQGDIYEMPDYFLYTGSISGRSSSTGSTNVSFIEI